MALVEVARTVLLRRKEPFGDEDGLVCELTQTVEVLVRNTAVWHIHIVIGRDYVHVGCHIAYGIGIIINLQTVAKQERFRICLADGTMRQSIIMLGYHTRPPSEHSNTLTARTEVCPDITALEECLKGGDAGRWHKVAQKSFPGVRIVLAQERHQLLFGVIRGRELQIIGKQRAVPPANFIIREIANAVGTVFVRRHQTMCPGAHVLFHGRAKGIAPDEKRLASEL